MKNFLAAVKKYVTLMVYGGLVGGAVVAWFGPGVAVWWATPGSGEKAWSCEKDVQYATSGLVKYQIISAIGAALTFAVVGKLVSMAMAGREAKKAAAAAIAAQSERATAELPGETKPTGT